MNSEMCYDFVAKIIDMTMQKKINWKLYSDGDLMIHDINGIFMHHEFCMLDTTRSFYTNYLDHFVILAYETWENARDGDSGDEFRLFVGEEGKHGFISQLKFDEDPYPILSELSYHIRDSINNSEEKADAFIKKILNS